MAKNLNPQSITNKWLSGVQNGVQAYKDGVSGVSESPSVAAARSKDKWLSGIQDAYSSGRFENGCNSVSKEQWVQAAIDRGSSRLASGAAASKGKMQSFLNNFVPALQSAMAQVNQMPDATYEQRKAKSAAMQDALHAMKGRFNGR